jgi:hypothetical protein
VCELGRVADPDRLLDDGLEHGGLVGRLVEHAAPDPGTAQAGGDVGCDDEHRLARGPRLADRGERVRGARAGGGEGDPEAAARARVAVGRIGGRLLVADPDEPDRRFREHGPERQVVHPRKAEGDLHAGLLERLHREAGAVQRGARARHPRDGGSSGGSRWLGSGVAGGATGIAVIVVRPRLGAVGSRPMNAQPPPLAAR